MIWSSLRYQVGRWAPKSARAHLRGYLNKRAAKRRQIRREDAIARYGQFDASELASALREAGLVEGSVVFAQCSFDDMYTFQGNPIGVLKALMTTVGPSGTLLMPAYSRNTLENPARPFYITTEPTYTGIVPELFRRLPGVVRSLHPRHSICGCGPLAESLLDGHDVCVRADGPDSPFDRLRQRSDSFIVTLGLPFGITSFFHWVEDYEPEKLPFRVHRFSPVRCLVRDVAGNEREAMDLVLRPEVSATESSGRVAKLLSARAMTVREHKGMLICVYAVKNLADELSGLRDRGIIHYQRPGWWQTP
jgi:aminoglycoside 3-N-acetyltransferase